MLLFKAFQNSRSKFVKNQNKQKFYLLVFEMSYRRQTTFGLFLINLLRAVKAEAAEEAEVEFLSAEVITFILFIIHLVVIGAFVVAHCRKSEELSEDETPKILKKDKLKQQ